MSRTIKFVGTAMVMATADGEYRMELKGPPGCAMWSADDVGKSFSVHIAEIEGGLPSWDDVPEWVQWRAQDRDGEWCGYERRPSPGEGVGFFCGGGRPHRICRRARNPKWRDTLQERPKPRCVEFSGGCIYLDNGGTLRIKLSDEAADKFTGIVVCQNSTAVTAPSPDWDPAWADEYCESVGISKPEPLSAPRTSPEIADCPGGHATCDPKVISREWAKMLGHSPVRAYRVYCGCGWEGPERETAERAIDAWGRAKPEPAVPPSWDDAPEFAGWRGQNLNGAWYWYHSRPEQGAFSCYETTPLVRWKPGMYGWNCYALCGTPNPNWRDTLQQRPEPEPPCPVCGKPQSEHRDGLFCCPHCGGSMGLFEWDVAPLSGGWCSQCDDCWSWGPVRKDKADAIEAGNRRA